MVFATRDKSIGQRNTCRLISLLVRTGIANNLIVVGLLSLPELGLGVGLRESTLNPELWTVLGLLRHLLRVVHRRRAHSGVGLLLLGLAHLFHNSILLLSAENKGEKGVVLELLSSDFLADERLFVSWS